MDYIPTEILRNRLGVKVWASCYTKISRAPHNELLEALESLEKRYLDPELLNRFSFDVEDKIKEFKRSGKLFDALELYLLVFVQENVYASALVKDLSKPDLRRINQQNLIVMDKKAVDAIKKTFLKVRKPLSDHLQKRDVELPTIYDIDWRIDVVVSNSNSTNVMKPVILFELLLSDGRIIKFEASYEKFQELRMEISKVLVTLDGIDQRRILPIIDETYEYKEI